MWPWKRRRQVEEAPAPAGDTLREVIVRLQAVENAHDDLHDQFRRFRGRMTKRMAVDEGDREAAPADGAAGAPRPRAQLGTISSLRASGRWPLKG